MLPPHKQLLPIRWHLQLSRPLLSKTVPRSLLRICSFNLCHLLTASSYICQLCQSSHSNCNYPSPSKPNHHCSSQPSQWYNILPQYCSLQEHYSSYLPSSYLPSIMQLQHSISLYQYLQICNTKSSKVSSLILRYYCIKHHLLKLHTTQHYKHKPPAISSFSIWMQAWNIYMSVILTQNAVRALELIGYTRIITSANQSHPLKAWLQYDGQFRTLSASNPHLRWDLRHPELWCEAMATANAQSNTN